MSNELINNIELEEELDYLDKSIDEPEDIDDEEDEELIEIDKNAEIKMGILKPRAEKLPDITDEMWLKVCEDNRSIFNEFFDVQQQLSIETRKQYRSCIKQFFYYTYTSLGNKPLYKITKRDFMRFMAYLQNRGLSSSAIGLRKSAVSSLCNYVETIVAESQEEYKVFRNITRGMPAIPKTQTYDKKPITKDEYELMKTYFLQHKKYLPLAYIVTLWGVGCRRSEVVQFKTEILQYEAKEGQKYIESHKIRAKGKGLDGKVTTYNIPLNILEYWKLWIDNRGFESEFVFARLNENGESVQISKQWGNRLMEDIISPLLHRRVTVHNFKATIVTRMLEEGADISAVSKFVAKHNDVSTTSNFYDLRTFEDTKKEIFNNITV